MARPEHGVAPRLDFPRHPPDSERVVDENGVVSVSLALTEDHRALAEVAKEMVTARAGLSGARKILLDKSTSGRWWSDDALWAEIVSTGWLGLHIEERDRKSTRLNSSHVKISYAVFCLKEKKLTEEL